MLIFPLRSPVPVSLSCTTLYQGKPSQISVDGGDANGFDAVIKPEEVGSRVFSEAFAGELPWLFSAVFSSALSAAYTCPPQRWEIQSYI